MDTGTPTDTDTDTDTAADTDSGTDTDSGLRTLDNCVGIIGSGVPEPFATWFDCADWDADATSLTVFTASLPPHTSPYYESTDANYVAFDDRGGGEYHHRGSNPAALAVLVGRGIATTNVPGKAEVELYGIMCDGTVVLGCTELNGSAPIAKLDAQNGHIGTLAGPDGSSLFTDRYHVHACAALGRTLAPEIQYYEDSGSCL